MTKWKVINETEKKKIHLQEFKQKAFNWERFQNFVCQMINWDARECREMGNLVVLKSKVENS